jgi:methionine-rich copper-binding protein CopC
VFLKTYRRSPCVAHVSAEGGVMSESAGSVREGAHLDRFRPSCTRPWLLWSVLLVVAACSVVWSAPPAWAHTSLVSSTPASGAVLVDPVEVVTLAFSQPVSPRQVQVVVTGPDGEDLGQGAVQVSGGTVSRSLGAWSQSGEHQLAYRVLAQDGHPITGQVRFSVALPAGAAPTPSPSTAVPSITPREVAGSAQPTVAQGTSVVPALVAGLAGVAVLLVVAGVRAGRRTQVGG